MRWIKRNGYYLESEDKRFTVSKSYSRGVPKYFLWRRLDFPLAEQLSGPLDSADEAKKMVEAFCAGERRNS